MNKLYNIYIVLLITGFLLVGTLPKLVGISENSLTIQFRAIIFILSIILILTTVFSKKVKKIKLTRYFPFLFFWFIYIIRIFYDLYLIQININSDKSISEYLQFTFGVVLIPSLCTMLIIESNKVNFKWVLGWVYKIIFFTLFVAIVFREGADTTGRTAGDVDVGILLFGQSGATLCILSIYYLATERYNLNKFLFYLLGFVVGFLTIFISASKSPLLSLVIVAFFFFLIWYGSIKSMIFITLFGILIYFYFIDIIIYINHYFNSNFLDRLFYAIEIGGDETREQLIFLAINEFIENPIFGNSLFIQSGNYVGAYPHNLIVESLMSTGIIGTIFFLAWICKCLFKLIKAIKRRSDIMWIGLIFLQYLIFGMFSKSLYNSDSFWILSVFFIGAQFKFSMNVRPLEQSRIRNSHQ